MTPILAALSPISCSLCSSIICKSRIDSLWWETQGHSQKAQMCYNVFFLPFFSLVLATGRTVCLTELQIKLVVGDTINVWLYFFLLGIIDTYSGVLGAENTWFLFSWEKFLFPLIFLFSSWITGKRSFLLCYLFHSLTDSYVIGGQHLRVPGYFWTQPQSQRLSLLFSFLPPTSPKRTPIINFIQINIKECSENHWFTG